MEKRFESKYWVDSDTGCFVWTASTLRGYGRFWVRGKPVYAHRHAFEVTSGPIPDGMVVCHSCDNPSCVNPSHLFLGTQRDNMHDMLSKGREPRGEMNGGARLTFVQVEEIREIRKRDGATYRELAEKYGVSHSSIGNIVRGRKWKDQLVIA